MRTSCKCHGLSGSCNLKTCWRKMPTLRDIGTRLRARYDSALKVTGSNDGTDLILAAPGVSAHKPQVTSIVGVPGYHELRPLDQEDIIYTENSPSFCQPIRSLRFPGTAGRLCDPISMGVGGCDNLCCGRGYRTQKVTEYSNCHCKFHWCCEVKCQMCLVRKEVARCL